MSYTRPAQTARGRRQLGAGIPAARLTHQAVPASFAVSVHVPVSRDPLCAVQHSPTAPCGSISDLGTSFADLSTFQLKKKIPKHDLRRSRLEE